MSLAILSSLTDGDFVFCNDDVRKIAASSAAMSRTLRVLTKFCFAKLAAMIEKDGLPRFSCEETTDSSVIVGRDSAIFTKHLT